MSSPNTLSTKNRSVFVEANLAANALTPGLTNDQIFGFANQLTNGTFGTVDGRVQNLSTLFGDDADNMRVQIMALLTTRLNPNNGNQVDVTVEFLKRLERIERLLNDLADCQGDLAGLQRRQEEILRYEAGKVNVGQRAQLHMAARPVGGVGSDQVDLEHAQVSLWDSIKGSRDVINFLARNSDYGPVIADAPNSAYKNTVNDGMQTLQAEKAALRQILDLTLRQGSLLDQQQEQEVEDYFKKRYGVYQNPLVRNSAEFALSFVQDMVGFFVKNPKATDAYKDYTQRLNELIRNNAPILDASRRDVAYLKSLLHHYQGLMITSPQMSAELQKLIAEIEAKIKVSEQHIETFNKEVETLSNNFVSKLEGVVDERNGMMFARFLQIALLACPFLPFGYMGLASNLLSPFFNVSFAQGIGGIITNLPVIGYIPGKMKVDVAMQWIIENFPILSDFNTALTTVFNSGVMQEASEIGFVFANASQILPILIAVMYSAGRIDPELSHLTKEIKTEEDAKAFLEKAFEVFSKKGNPLRNFADQFSVEEMKFFIFSKQVEGLMNSVLAMQANNLSIFDDIKVDCEIDGSGKVVKMSLSDIAKQGLLTGTSPAQQNLEEFFRNVSSEQKKAMIKAMLVFVHECNSDMRQFVSLKADLPKLAAAEEKWMKKDEIDAAHKVGADLGITSTAADAANKIRQSLRGKAEREELRDVPPSSSPAPAPPAEPIGIANLRSKL